MEITIKGQSPDGLNIKVENIIFDTVEEATNFVKLLYSIRYNMNKITEKEIKEMAKKISKL